MGFPPWPPGKGRFGGRTTMAKTCKCLLPPGECQRGVAWTGIPPFTKLVWSLLLLCWFRKKLDWYNTHNSLIIKKSFRSVAGTLVCGSIVAWCWTSISAVGTPSSWAARCIGVRPFLAWAFTSAECSSSNATISEWPSCAARCSGLKPFCTTATIIVATQSVDPPYVSLFQNA